MVANSAGRGSRQPAVSGPGVTRGEFPAACATILVLLTPTGCGEMHTPAEPTPMSVARTDRTAPAPSHAGRVVVAGADAGLGDDDYVLNSATITGDTLALSVSYSGGCRAHEFTLVIAASFVESRPVRLPALLRHHANGDTCEAFPTESYTFDLALVRARYREVYGLGAGRVALPARRRSRGQSGLRIHGVGAGHLSRRRTAAGTPVTRTPRQPPCQAARRT